MLDEVTHGLITRILGNTLNVNRIRRLRWMTEVTERNKIKNEYIRGSK